MINRVILVGNLTRDPEPVAGARTPMTRLRIATNAAWRDAEGNRQESSEFHSVVAFARLAETCGQYCRRGMRVYVEGRLRTREYVPSDGVRRFSTDVVADTVRFLSPRAAGAADGEHPDSDDTAHAAAPDPEADALAAVPA